MKCYLCIEQRDHSLNPCVNSDTTYFVDEKIARKNFLQDVFHLFFIISESTKYSIMLESFPFGTEEDIYFFVGHWNAVDREIERLKDSLRGKTIAIVSCVNLDTKRGKILEKQQAKHNLELLKSLHAKNIYVDKSNRYTNFYKRGHCGFDFQVTDIEILLYRFKEQPLDTKIKNVFMKIS